jgi:phytoene dehydrogenase-like protein
MSSVVIIGAGLGGLSAGIRLAQKGHRVTIFEKHNLPGGYVAGFRRKGFYFESGTLSFEASRQVFGAMKELGVFERLEFSSQHSCFKSVEFDFCPKDYGEFKEGILKAFPDHNDRLKGYFKAVDPMYAPMKTLVDPNAAIPSLVWAGLRVGLQYLKYRKMTITEFTAKYFDRGSKLFRIFKSFGYPEMAVWILGGAYASVFNDYWTIKKGMQSWADVLAARFTELGGKLDLSSPVERIVTRNGRATGVISRGSEYQADWVISGSDYKKTFLNLLDDRNLIPEALLQKVEKTMVSEGIFTVYLGLNIPGERLRAHMRMPHAIYLDEQAGADVRNSNDPDFFTKCSVNLYSPSLHDSGLAPEGKSSLMIQMVSPHRWMDNWGGGDREKYKTLKEKVMNIMIDKAAKVVPDLRSLIEFSDAATPLTYERYTGNTDGATSAWSWNPNKKFHKGIGTYVKTPIKNLLIGSCWATQIGGVPGALSAGKACAKLVK